MANSGIDPEELKFLEQSRLICLGEAFYNWTRFGKDGDVLTVRTREEGARLSAHDVKCLYYWLRQHFELGET